MYFWLSSADIAIKRVAKRVLQGGHNIPTEIVQRRYKRSLYNLVNLYIDICDRWMINNNEELLPAIVAQKNFDDEIVIFDTEIWNKILTNNENR